MGKSYKKNYNDLKEIFKMYNLTNKEMRYIWKVIKPIYCHDEFQKRMIAPFYHHQDITLGEHIIEDTIFVYKSCIKKKQSDLVIKRAMLIAMFHDLYVRPWMQRNVKQYFINSHAFIHPIEAVVNAITWFPSYFENLEDSKIIIDGILHHMYPCPVRANSSLIWEIANFDLYEKLDDKYKKIILCSLEPCCFRNLSLRNSFYFEGRILSKVDKIITMRKDLKGIKALQTAKTLAYAVFSSKSNN